MYIDKILSNEYTAENPTYMFIKQSVLLITGISL